MDTLAFSDLCVILRTHDSNIRLLEAIEHI